MRTDRLALRLALLIARSRRARYRLRHGKDPEPRFRCGTAPD
jgi:hypothetical protein